jgi:hypothetical protein
MINIKNSADAKKQPYDSGDKEKRNIGLANYIQGR